MGSGGSAFRRRVERAAELRAVRSAGSTAQEHDELTAAEEELRQKRAKVDDAAKAEYLIRDAMAQGKFDNLKYAGKPIPGLGEAYDPDWWVKGLLQRENITGLGPKAILLRTEDAALDARLDAQFSEKQVRDILEDFNGRVVPGGAGGRRPDSLENAMELAVAARRDATAKAAVPERATPPGRSRRKAAGSPECSGELAGFGRLRASE
jgi:hypothetical protein